MKGYHYALLAISCSLAYFSSIFKINEVSCIYLLACAYGSVAPTISLNHQYYSNNNSIIALISKLNSDIIYPISQFISRSKAPYQNRYLLNIIPIAINGFIWYMIFKLLQLFIPSKYDPALCGWMVFFGGCITTIFFCGTNIGVRPLYPLIKKKYYGRVDHVNPNFLYYCFLASGFILFASTIFQVLSPDFAQIGIIISSIGYLIFSGTFQPNWGSAGSRNSISSIISVFCRLGAIICFILAFVSILHEIINSMSWYAAAFPTIYALISVIISSLSQFPLSLVIVSIHTQIQSHLSFLGISGIWWSIVLMIVLGIILSYCEKILSGQIQHGILNSRGFSIFALISMIFAVIVIIVSIWTFLLANLPQNVLEKTQPFMESDLTKSYSQKESEYNINTEKKQEIVPSSGPSSINADRVESLLSSMINQQRSQAGLSALNCDGGLTSLAKSRSANMAGRRTVDHQGIPEGIGENCAMNYASGSDDSVAQGIMNMWMNSQGHRENILNREYTRFGVGVTVSGNEVYAVLDFMF